MFEIFVIFLVVFFWTKFIFNSGVEIGKNIENERVTDLLKKFYGGSSDR